MRRPWQVWTLFFLSLGMVVPAMVWLTHMTLELDRAEVRARRHAELEEAVGSCLWQMDSLLTGLLAPEIGRPPFFYRPFYVDTGGKGGLTTRPSPLLGQSSPYVIVHFEVGEDGGWSSPQCPEDEQRELAISNGRTEDELAYSRQRLDRLAERVDYDQLIDQLPHQDLDVQLQNPTIWASNTALTQSLAKGKVFRNVLDNEQVQQQMASVQQLEIPSQAESQQGEAPQGLNLGELAAFTEQRVQSRRSNDLLNRDALAQNAARQALWDQRANFFYQPPQAEYAEGVSQPIWIGDTLLLARRVRAGQQTRIQGCWLDWARIKHELLTQAAVDLPGADLEPIRKGASIRLTRVLATIPVQLVVPQPVPGVNPLSPIRVSLAVAWLFLLLAAVAMAVLLQGVVTLSERRAAFVSAVTHELRTPLTTFRMYAEMLQEGMVGGEAQKQHYLKTLQIEADRLAHLVENVLQYARLERGRQRRPRERVGIGDLLDRFMPRLQQRAEQAEMLLELEIPPEVRGRCLITDAAAVEQILFNLVDNACKYAAQSKDRRIHLRVRAIPPEIVFELADHGPGLSGRANRGLFRAFRKSAQQAADSAAGVGLGLALCRRLARQLGGKLEVDNGAGTGAVFQLRLKDRC